MAIIGVASPKGGCGKTTCTVNLADTVAHYSKARGLVVDADLNRSSADYIEDIGDRSELDVAIGTTPSRLRKLDRIQDYRWIWADLPGRRTGGELRALLEGDDGRPIADFLVVPLVDSHMDLLPTVRAVRSDIEPTGASYAVLLTMVDPRQLRSATKLQEDLRERGVVVLDTVIRYYTAFKDARGEGLPIRLSGGRHSNAREGERDINAAAREITRLAGHAVKIPNLPGRH